MLRKQLLNKEFLRVLCEPIHSEFNYERETSPAGRFGSPGGSCQMRGSAGDEGRNRLEGWGGGCPR